MEFFRISNVKDFTDCSIRSFRVFGKIIAIVRDLDGGFFAIEGGCKHHGADLSQGVMEQLIVTCPRHGWKYDLSTGKCLSNASLPLRKLPLKIIGDEIHIKYEFIENQEELDW